MMRGSLSHWLKVSNAWSHPSNADAKTRADICIVGAGITGCALALHLRNLDPQLKIAIVEARGISEGATGRNGGLMWPSLNAPWPTTVAMYGHGTAKALMDYELRAFEDVLRFIKDNDLEDELQFSIFPDGGLTLCETQDEWEAELADLKAQQQVGVQPFAKPLTPDEVASLLQGPHRFVGGLVQPQVARVTAVRLAHALLRKAAAIEPKDNLTVMQHMRVTHIERVHGDASNVTSGQQLQVHAEPSDEGTVTRNDMVKAVRQPVMIQCSAVVHCTNGYNQLLKQLNQREWLVPVRNQVAVTAPLPPEHPLPHAAYYARGGFVYWSRRHDNRIVLGGFRDVTPHLELGTTDDSFEGLNDHVSKQLRSFLPSTFPHLFVNAAPTATHINSACATQRPMHRYASQQHAVLSAAPAASTIPLHEGCTAEVMKAVTEREDDGVSRSHNNCVEIEYELEWSGILGFTKDRWPLVGMLPPQLAAATSSHHVSCYNGNTGEYCCMGFSGHGMTRAYNCARNMALMLLNQPLEQSFPTAVFSPDRVMQPARSLDPPMSGLPAPLCKL